MNKTVKTVLLTVLTLSVFTIAIIELLGVSKYAVFNKLTAGVQETNNSGYESINVIPKANASETMDLPATEIMFTSDHHDFGKLKQGDVVEYVYKFKNVGKNPLMIREVNATCGCTVPTFTKTPVPPGAEGEVAISYNSKGQMGNVDKQIYINSNAQSPRIPLSFKAQVEP